MLRLLTRAVLAALCMTLLTSTFSVSFAESATTELEEVVVYDNEFPETDLPMGTGISGATLKDTTGASGDPFRGLQTLPGFGFTDDENTEPAIRGARPGDNLYQIDFIPVTYVSHADNAVSVFNSDLIESFSIYPSAFGPEFVGVSGGVFDIQLRDPAKDQYRTTMDFNFLHSGLLIEGPVSETQSFYVAGRFSYLDVFVEDQLDEDTEYKQFPKYTDYQSKYVWNINDKSTIRFQALGASDDFEALVPFEDATTDAFSGIARSEIAIRDFESTAFHQQAIVLDTKLSDSIQSKTALAHTQSNGEEQNAGTTRFNQSNRQWLFKSFLEAPLSEKHLLSFGASFSNERSTSTLLFNAQDCQQPLLECESASSTLSETKEVESNDLLHVFLKDSWFVTDKLYVFPGIALFANDGTNETFIEPRFALEYSAREDLVLSFGAALNHQSAEQNQLSELYGNPELESIESVDWVLGAQSTYWKGWDLKAELYYKKLDNLVRFDETQIYNNSAEGEAYGFEAFIRKTIGERFTGWLSFSLADATRKDNNNEKKYPFAFSQPYNISLVGKYSISKKWDIGAKLWVHSGAPYTPIVGSTPDPNGTGGFIPQFGTINSDRYPAYQRFDLRLDRTFMHRGNKKAVASLEVLNLFDRENVLSYRYNADFSNRLAFHQLPRIFGLGVKLYF